MSIPDPFLLCPNAPGRGWKKPPRSPSGTVHAMFFRYRGRANSREPGFPSRASIPQPKGAAWRGRRRRMAGLYFEEFEEGQIFEHAISRTVTEMDNVLFTTLTMNPQPLHLDEEFAKQTEFGQRLVNSLFTLGLVIGISVGETTLGTTIANLGLSEVRFPKPVF